MEMFTTGLIIGAMVGASVTFFFNDKQAKKETEEKDETKEEWKQLLKLTFKYSIFNSPYQDGAVYLYVRGRDRKALGDTDCLPCGKSKAIKDWIRHEITDEMVINVLSNK